MKDLQQDIFIENLSINVEYLNNRTGEITDGVCLMYITVFFFSIWLIEQRWNWNNDNHRYNSFSTSTKLKCAEKSKGAVKNALKIERKKKYHHWKETSPRTRKKCKKAKVRHYRDPELKRQYQKRKYQKNLEQEKEL